MKCVVCQDSDAREGAASGTCGDKCYQQQRRDIERQTMMATPIEAIDHFNLGRIHLLRAVQ